MQDHTLAVPYKIDPFFAIILPIINAFDSEWIAKRFDRLLESHTMVAQISRGLSIAPFKRIIIHIVRVTADFVEDRRRVAVTI